MARAGKHVTNEIFNVSSGVLLPDTPAFRPGRRRAPPVLLALCCSTY